MSIGIQFIGAGKIHVISEILNESHYWQDSQGNQTYISGEYEAKLRKTNKTILQHRS